MNKKCVVRIFPSQNPCWIASFEDGDPPRTVVYNNAQIFENIHEAKKRIVEVRKTHPLKHLTYRIKPIYQ